MDEVEVALTLLSRLPPSRKVVNLDAGLMNRRVVEQVKEKGALRRPVEGQPARGEGGWCSWRGRRGFSSGLSPMPWRRTHRRAAETRSVAGGGRRAWEVPGAGMALAWSDCYACER